MNLGSQYCTEAVDVEVANLGTHFAFQACYCLTYHSLNLFKVYNEDKLFNIYFIFKNNLLLVADRALNTLMTWCLIQYGWIRAFLLLYVPVQVSGNVDIKHQAPNILFCSRYHWIPWNQDCLMLTVTLAGKQVFPFSLISQLIFHELLRNVNFQQHTRKEFSLWKSSVEYPESRPHFFCRNSLAFFLCSEFPYKTNLLHCVLPGFLMVLLSNVFLLCVFSLLNIL